MSSQVYALTHGTKSLVVGYLAIQIPLLVGLIRGRAPFSKLVLSPAAAIPLTLAMGIFFTLLSPLWVLLGVEHENWPQLVLGVVLSAAAGYASGRLLAARTAAASTWYRRGAIVADAAAAHGVRGGARASRGEADPHHFDTCVRLAGMRTARDDETKHFKIIGTTGTGKSTAIREVLSTALKRGDRAVIADPDGGYLRRFYDPVRGDQILNPFESDSVKWNLLGEIASDYDVDQMARSLITDNGDPDRSWSEYARTFFIAVTQQIRTSHITDDREVYRLVAKASVKELKLLLAGTAAGPFLEEGNECMFGSVR